MYNEIKRLNKDDPVIGNADARVSYSSDIWGWYSDGELILVWGLAPLSQMSDTAYVWSILKSPIPNIRVFLRGARLIMAEMLDLYPRIYGFTDCHTALVRHLGATLADREDSEGEYYFEINHG